MQSFSLFSYVWKDLSGTISKKKCKNSGQYSSKIPVWLLCRTEVIIPLRSQISVLFNEGLDLRGMSTVLLPENIYEHT